MVLEIRVPFWKFEYRYGNFSIFPGNKKIPATELDGDQLVDFYWVDPLLSAERIVAKSKYAGKLSFNLSQRSHGTGLEFEHLVVSMGG